MKTEILIPDDDAIRKCADCIADGGVVAFPTETVYGLGADAFDEAATRKIFEVKGRPSDNPLIVHVATQEQLRTVVRCVPPLAERLMQAFMPGALTLIMEKNDKVPDTVTAGLSTVGVRMPENAVCRRFLQACRHPVCAPSANTSGKPSPTTAAHVYEDLQGKIPYILDGGESRIGLESTILDVSVPTPRLLRTGGISREALEEVCGCAVETNVRSDVALCPGMKYRHYAPRADVYFSAYYEGMTAGICNQYDVLVQMGRRPVILCLRKTAAQYGARSLYVMGKDYEAYAHNLFSMLRRADAEQYDAVIAEGMPSDGIGAAIINRLIKSSGGKII